MNAMNENPRNKTKKFLVALNLKDQSKEGEERIASLLRFSSVLETLSGIQPHLVYVSNNSSETEIYQEKLKSISEDKRWDYTMLEGNLADSIPDLIRSRNPPVEFILLRMRKSSFTDYFINPSVSESLSRIIRRPLIILGPHIQEDHLNSPPADAPLKLLVATDLGRNSRPAEHYALSLAKKTGASITLLHNTWQTYKVMEESAIQSGMVPLEFSELDESIHKKAKSALDQKISYFQKKGVSCEGILDLEARHAADTILHYSHGHNGILMGTRGRSRFLNLFWGSTLSRILENSPLPIIVVRG